MRAVRRATSCTPRTPGASGARLRDSTNNPRAEASRRNVRARLRFGKNTTKRPASSVRAAPSWVGGSTPHAATLASGTGRPSSVTTTPDTRRVRGVTTMSPISRKPVMSGEVNSTSRAS